MLVPGGASLVPRIKNCPPTSSAAGTTPVVEEMGQPLLGLHKGG